MCRQCLKLTARLFLNTFQSSLRGEVRRREMFLAFVWCHRREDEFIISSVVFILAGGKAYVRKGVVCVQTESGLAQSRVSLRPTWRTNFLDVCFLLLAGMSCSARLIVMSVRYDTVLKPFAPPKNQCWVKDPWLSYCYGRRKIWNLLRTLLTLFWSLNLFAPTFISCLVILFHSSSFLSCVWIL